MNDYNLLLTKIKEQIAEDRPWRLVCSKPRTNKHLKKLTITQFNLGQGLKYKVVKHTKTQAFTDVLDGDEILERVGIGLNDEFFFADLWTNDVEWTLMQSKKGKQTLIKKKAKKEIAIDQEHNTAKSYHISSDRPYLKLLGISTEAGKVHARMQRKYRQINKFVENIEHLTKQEVPASVVDMGSGKGYLTFALYDYLSQVNPDVVVKGFEIRQDIVDKCNAVANQCGYTLLSFHVGDIGSVDIGDVDMTVALHACDIATDMAIAKGIESGSKYIVVAPCCHKQVRKDISVSDPILKHGILAERQAEIVTDAVRALLLQSKGYDTKIFEFVDLEHTAKNLMITARNTGKIVDVAADVASVKARVGVARHYLEDLLEP